MTNPLKNLHNGLFRRYAGYKKSLKFIQSAIFQRENFMNNDELCEICVRTLDNQAEKWYLIFSTQGHRVLAQRNFVCKI